MATKGNQSNEVYRKLYRIVNDELAQHGKQPLCSEDVFAFFVATRPGICDGRMLSDLLGVEFAEGVYVGALGRFIDSGAQKSYTELYRDHPDVFYECVLDTIITSQEFLIKSGRFIRNHSSLPKQRALNMIDHLVKERTGLIQEEASQIQISPVPNTNDIDIVQRIAAILPASVKSVLRKIIRR